jgi:restriction endonuclease Mrr
MFKRLAFQHEREVRVGTFRNEVHEEFFNSSGFLKTAEPGVIAENILRFPERKGVYVDIDVAELIDKVVVSPFSPDWFSELVVSVLQKMGYGFEVIPSQMLRPSSLWQP